MNYEEKLALWLFNHFYPSLSEETVTEKVLPHAEEICNFYFQLARNLGLGEYLYRGIPVEELETVAALIREDKELTERYPLLWYRRFNEDIKEFLLKYLTR